MAIELPAGLLPRRFADLLEEWKLNRAGDELWHGYCSLVAPVMTPDGARAVVKITFDGDDESRHEGLALQRWQGAGAVRLRRADPHRRVLLLERLERGNLTRLTDLQACEIVADLYQQLHVPPPRLSGAGGDRRRAPRVVAVVPVSGQLNLKALASAVGGKKAAIADPDRAERSTGYVVGGISPIGQKRALPTVIDVTAMEFSSVLVSGGRRGLDIEIMPEHLVRVTNARSAPIGRPD